MNRTSRPDSGFPQGKDAEPLKSYARKAQRRSVREKLRVERGCAALARSGPASLRFAFSSLLFAFLSLLVVAIPQSAVRADIALPVGDARDTIQIQAEEGQRWRLGEYEVWLLPRGLSVQQGRVMARAKQAVLWIHRRESEGADVPNKVLAYLEDEVQVDFGHFGNPHPATGAAAQSIRDRQWFGRFHTLNEVRVRVTLVADEPATKPEVWRRATEAFDAGGEWPVRQAQFSIPERPASVRPPAPGIPPGSPLPPPAGVPGFPPAIPPGMPGPVLPATPAVPAAPASPPPSAGIAKIESRTGSRFDFRTFNGPDGRPAGIIFDSGVRIVFDAIKNVQLQNYMVERIDVETDRIVVWGDLPAGLSGQAIAPAAPAGPPRPIELYMEGNIVFREGDRVIYAERMYYNVTERRGVVLAAEMLTPVPEYEGLLRLKADAIQMYNEQQIQAFGAAVTSSRLGVPRYWFQSETLTFQDQQRPKLNPYTRMPDIDPRTGEPLVEHEYLATSTNNWVYLAGIPVLYWPTVATDLKEPTYYLQRAQVKNDSVFGTQVLLDWDLYQILGIRNRLPNTKWQLSTDVLTERGLGIGTNFRYGGDTLLGSPGPYSGSFDAWGIQDSGVDNLGSDRRALEPEKDTRGRILWQHRQRLPWELQLTAELGFITDRNFLEQYYEREWDQNKDLTTGLEIKRIDDNMEWALSADVRINEFFTQTEWLPRLDHYWLGQSLLGDILTWNEHSHVGYARLQITDAPKDPADLAKFDWLAWEVERSGVRAATRQELDLPFEVGAVKFVPYVLGEAAHWGEDMNGDPLTRVYGQAGLRTSLPFWRSDPSIQSELFNLNGLAHKVTLEAEFLYADASEDLDQLPLYDQVDDDSIEHFRRRLLFNTFDQVAGTNVPLQFDERYYALRSGLQGSVTSPSTEIADDLMMAKLGLHQRWQTKRGLPGQQRIIDWVVLDMQAALYPDPDRDNFGEVLGLVDYDFRWHIGDRLTLLSDGFADLFTDGLRTISLGGLIGRPEQGSLYVGFRTIEGPGPAGALTPLHSNVLTANLNYRMSEKWIVSGGASYDFGPAGNIGQAVKLTRVGESFLVQVGFNYDVSRDNFGASFLIEPRFMPGNRLGRVGGVAIPPAGAYGLE
ncbi:MAG: organic solvent tolerance protein OstA [Pirellulales bacterium]